MRPARAVLALVLAVGVLSAWAPAAPAQEAASQAPSPILTVDTDRLFAESAFGKAALARLQEAEAALVAENRRIEAELAAEEEALTARRATVPPDEFRTLAADFDTRVENIRATQEGKSRRLTQSRDDDRRRFLEAAVPVLGQLMADMGAVAILEKNDVFLSFDRIDVTATAIGRIDAVLGDGTAPPPDAPAPDAPAPDAPAPDAPAPESPAPESPATP